MLLLSSTSACSQQVLFLEITHNKYTETCTLLCPGNFSTIPNLMADPETNSNFVALAYSFVK